jgi:DNA invertase Pin-like site-specific DNA recombinase
VRPQRAREEAVTRYLSGATSAEIAVELRCSADTVLRWLRDAGVPLRRPGRRRRQDVDTMKIVKMHDDGMGWYLIGKELGMSHSAVRDRYRKHEQHVAVHRQRAHANREDD